MVLICFVNLGPKDGWLQSLYQLSYVYVFLVLSFLFSIKQEIKQLTANGEHLEIYYNKKITLMLFVSRNCLLTKQYNIYIKCRCHFESYEWHRFFKTNFGDGQFLVRKFFQQERLL